MAQNKDQDNYDSALGSIFDFMFTQAEKPVDKRKPIRPTGVSGSSEYTDMLETMLVNPAAFVGDTMVKSIEANFEVELAKIDIDTHGGQIEIKSTNVVDLIKDPNKFFKKQYEGARRARKASHIRWYAPLAQQIITQAYGQKVGMDSKDARILGEATRRAMAEAGYNRSQKGGRVSIRNQDYGLGVAARSYQNTDVQKLNEFVGKHQIEDQKARYENLLRNGGVNLTPRQIYTELDRYDRYRNTHTSIRSMAQKEMNEFLRSSRALSRSEVMDLQLKIKGGKGGFYAGNIKAAPGEKPTYNNNYLDVLESHYERSASNFQGQGNTADAVNAKRSEEIIKNLKNQRLLSSYSGELKRIRTDISNARGQNLGQDYIDNLRSQEQFWLTIKRSDRLNQLGQIEGFVNAWNASWSNVASKNLIPSMLNGTFFDSRGHKNAMFSPSQSFKKHKYGRNGKEYAVKMHTARVGPGSIYNQKWANTLNDLYYFTPAGIISTLTTGEAFAHQLFKKRNAYIAQLQGDEKKWLQRFINEGDSTELQAFLAANANGRLATMWSSICADEDRLGKRIQRFGIGTRFKSNTSDALKSLLVKGLRLDPDKIGKLGDMTAGQIVNVFLAEKVWNAGLKGFLQNRLSQEAFEEISEQFLTGSLKVGLKAFIQTLLFAGTSLVGTPVAGAVTWIVTETIVSIGFKSIQYIFFFFMLFALGLFAIISVGIIGGGGELMGLLNNHSHITPIEINQCEAFYGIEPIIDDYEPGGPLVDFEAGSLPAGEQCLLGESTYGCSQGAYGDFSHSNVAANDYTGVNYFHAPAFCDRTKKNCTVTYVGDVNCTAGYAGGMVIFTAEHNGQTYLYKLIHVASNASVGRSLDSGERVARVMTLEETGTTCSTGMHLHLETKLNGETVNPYDVMTSSTKQGGFGCEISACP